MKYIFRHKIALALGIIVAVLGAGLGMRCWFRQATNLDAVPPAQAFTRVFKMPVPKGVSQLKVAGEAHLSGVVWMRFQVANMDAFLHSLRKHGVVLEPADELWIHTANIRSSRYAAMVEWERALLIANPRRYRFSMQPPGTGWTGELLLDPQQKIIYLRADLL